MLMGVAWTGPPGGYASNLAASFKSALGIIGVGEICDVTGILRNAVLLRSRAEQRVAAEDPPCRRDRSAAGCRQVVVGDVQHGEFHQPTSVLIL